MNPHPRNTMCSGSGTSESYRTGRRYTRAMRWRQASSLLKACVVAGCTKAPAPEGTGDQTLAPILHDYVVEFLRRSPTTNTYLGGAGFDAKLREVDSTLRDYSPAALAEEDRWLKDTQGKLTAISPATLSPNAAIDRDV